MVQQELLPNARVRVTVPTLEHQRYLNATGRILDVRDFDHRFCQVELDGQVPGPIWFEATELTFDQAKRRTNDEEAT